MTEPAIGTPERDEWAYQLALSAVRAAESGKPAPEVAMQYKPAFDALYLRTLKRCGKAIK